MSMRSSNSRCNKQVSNPRSLLVPSLSPRQAHYPSLLEMIGFIFLFNEEVAMDFRCRELVQQPLLAPKLNLLPHILLV